VGIAQFTSSDGRRGWQRDSWAHGKKIAIKQPFGSTASLPFERQSAIEQVTFDSQVVA
jgi:hypothetical protein